MIPLISLVLAMIVLHRIVMMICVAHLLPPGRRAIIAMGLGMVAGGAFAFSGELDWAAPMALAGLILYWTAERRCLMRPRHG